jgi:hypothetical protein
LIKEQSEKQEYLVPQSPDNLEKFQFFIAYFWPDSFQMKMGITGRFLILFFLLTGAFLSGMGAIGPGGPLHQPSRMPYGDTSNRDTSFLETLLNQYPAYFDQILRGRDSLQVQIIYTQIDRDKANNPSFSNYYFNIRPGKYFYPASTVKLPTAVLALQRIHELRLPSLDRNSTMITDTGYSGQTAVLNDPTTPDGRPTIAQYIRRILLVSDNDAFNRLYEFLGQEYINDRLHAMGYGDVQILHRLEVSLSPDENRHTNPVTFYDPSGRVLYHQPMQYCSRTWEPRTDSAGRAYYNGQGQLVKSPMNFSGKNKISLVDLHNILRSLLFPGSVSSKQRFGLQDEDYQFLRQYLSEYPSESIYPPYDSADYWDAYCKFMYWGNEKGPLPKQFRIFNKVGDAYGYLTDVTYVADFDRHIEFMVSASIYCNRDGIINDGRYDYDTVGLPFLKQLGRVLYEYESRRVKKKQPDLLEFRMKYDR